ncbi:MAG: hypothetical protein IK083_02595 [Abditibacteriota bacterium]|nr:hypothetical protein [Abditibacteriota bacterium]
MKTLITALLACICAAPLWAAGPGIIHKYTLLDDGSQRAYDEAAAAGCMQGLINREKPVLWMTGKRENTPDIWERIFTQKGRWLSGSRWEDVKPQGGEKDALDALFALAKDRIRGAVIWDPGVPASFDAAVTAAGAEDLVVLSPEFAREYLPLWKLEVKYDLRGRFDGSETGSAKNDAYRWAIREFLAKGRCSRDYLFLMTDAWRARRDGNAGFITSIDWAVANRGFAFDLSPWGTEAPGDDPDQPLGTDLETYTLILKTQYTVNGGKRMTELAGFFDFNKYSSVEFGSHHPVGTEWETVFIISPWNVYQNTENHKCLNKSFHSKFRFKNLKQRASKHPAAALENKTYICILMADYDSCRPLYCLLPGFWADPARGTVPLSWGINPNLINTYPDIVSYYYETATGNDYFVADATCAGYFNATRILPENMPLFVKHNQKYYRALDLDISPMVLDMMPPTDTVKDAYSKFSPRGYGSMVLDWHGMGSRDPEPQVWKGMPITTLYNTEDGPAKTSGMIRYYSPDQPLFFYLRMVWIKPSEAISFVEEVKKLCPEYDIEIVDPYTFFDLRKRDLIRKGMDLK